MVLFLVADFEKQRRPFRLYADGVFVVLVPLGQRHLARHREGNDAGRRLEVVLAPLDAPSELAVAAENRKPLLLGVASGLRVRAPVAPHAGDHVRAARALRPREVERLRRLEQRVELLLGGRRHREIPYSVFDPQEVHPVEMADPRLRVDGHRLDVAEGRRLDRPDRRRAARLDDLGQLLGSRVGDGRRRRKERELDVRVRRALHAGHPRFRIRALKDAHRRADVHRHPSRSGADREHAVCDAGRTEGKALPLGLGPLRRRRGASGRRGGRGRRRPRRRGADPQGDLLFRLGSARGQAHRRREHNNREPRTSHPRPPGEEPGPRSPPCPS